MLQGGFLAGLAFVEDLVWKWSRLVLFDGTHAEGVVVLISHDKVLAFLDRHGLFGGDCAPKLARSRHNLRLDLSLILLTLWIEVGYLLNVNLSSQSADVHDATISIGNEVTLVWLEIDFDLQFV